METDPNENIFNDEEQDIVELFEQCNFCGLTNDHALHCPNNINPYDQLIINGYD